MKKLFYFCALMLLMSQTSIAQTPSISIFQNSADSCVLNSIAQSVYGSGTIANATTGLNVLIHWGDGTTSTQAASTQGTTGWFGMIHNYAFSGTYTIMAVLLNSSNTPLDSSQITVEAFCYSIRGAVYKRNDANCTYDPTVDEYINNFQQIEVRKNNVAIDTFSVHSSYEYTIPQADQTSEFSFVPLNNPTFQQVCPSVATPYKVRLDTLNGINNKLDYGYTCVPGSGYDMFTTMTGLLRFTSFSYLHINVGNSSCTPQNGIVTLNIDPQYSFASALPAASSINGQTVTWNFNNLSGTDYQYISVTLTPVGILTPGDSACNTVTITPTSGDINVSNNTYTYCDTIRASMDPNEKKVSPIGAITAGQLLNYTINFENLGNDTAFNIHIIDTLSSNIDASSFKITSSSHAVNTTLFNSGSNKIVKFDFKGINLQDKDHPHTNKGYVMYQAKAKNNLVAGDEILNTAHIYFDINPAIVTNTVSSKIPNPTGLKEVSKEDGLKVYPNPVKNEIFIESTNTRFAKVQVVNTLGQVVLENNLSSGINKIDVSSIRSGMYYLLISGPEDSRSMKFSKQ